LFFFCVEHTKSLIWKPIIVEPGKWFCVDEGDVINKLRLFHKNHKAIKNNAKKLGMWNRSKFSLTTMARDFNKVIDKALTAIPESPKPMSLKLPKLKKVSSNSNKKPATIKLPKLKKVT
jgi:hypothetical protein